MSNEIKYLHFNSRLSKNTSKRFKKLFQSRTVAALTFEPEALRIAALSFISAVPSDENLGLYVRLGVGVAMLHPKDLYEKAKGRNQARVNMKEVNLKVIGVIATPTHVFVSLAPYKGVNLNLRLNKKTLFSTVTGALSGTEDDSGF